MIKIPYYETSYFCLSNFSAHSIVLKGEIYPTCEHAFHVQKFIDSSIKTEIMQSASPVAALALANQYKEKGVENWDDIKVEIMREILLAKAIQHPDVAEALLKTAEEEIVEESHSKFWGNGLDGSGQNWCGKLWMEVREKLKKE